MTIRVKIECDSPRDYRGLFTGGKGGWGEFHDHLLRPSENPYTVQVKKRLGRSNFQNIGPEHTVFSRKSVGGTVDGQEVKYRERLSMPIQDTGAQQAGDSPQNPIGNIIFIGE